MPEGAQRLDRWLFFARFTKTRSLAANLCETGKIRLKRGSGDPRRVDKAHHAVQIGDQLSFVVHDRAIAVEVLSLGTRRGPACEAQSLYRNLAPD